MTSNKSLPFELQPEALAAWLDTLRALPQAQAANQLAQALLQLKDQKCEAAVLLPLLLEMTPLCLRYAHAIATFVISEQPPSAKSHKAIKLSIQLLRQLALLFCQLLEKGTLASADRQSALYYALQCIGHCLRCYCLFYEPPSATLWKKSAALYEWAISEKHLQTPQAITLVEFKSQPSIASVLKRNLLFSVLSPTLYQPNEINQLFLLANHYADQVEISTIPANNDFGFYWDLNDEQPPATVRKAQRPLPLGFLAIDTHKVGMALQQASHAAAIDRKLQSRLSLQLSDYQAVFDSIVPGQTARTEFLFGFKAVSDFLLELNKLQKIRQLSGQPQVSNNARHTLALVPMEREKNAFETMSQALAKSNTPCKKGNVLKISHPDYLVAEGNTFDCSIGEIAMFYRYEEPAMLAIVREQSALSISNVMHILMEKIPGPYSIYTIKTSGTPQQAIVVDETGDDPQVFLPPGKYGVDSQIPLTIEETLHLTAYLESNSFFARFRFYFDS